MSATNTKARNAGAVKTDKAAKEPRVLRVVDAQTEKNRIDQDEQDTYAKIARQEEAETKWIELFCTTTTKLEWSEYDELFEAISVLVDAEISPEMALKNSHADGFLKDLPPATFSDWYLIGKSLFAVQEWLSMDDVRTTA